MTRHFDRDRRRIAYLLVVAVVLLSGYLAATKQITPQAVTLVAILTAAGLSAVGVSVDPRKRAGEDDDGYDRGSQDDEQTRTPMVGRQDSRAMGPIPPVAQEPSDSHEGLPRLPRHRGAWIRGRNRHRWSYHSQCLAA